MPHEPIWRRTLRFWRADSAADVDDELRFHLEARLDELVAEGLTPAAAREQAHVEFGDVEAVRTRLHAIGARRARRRGWVERLEVVRQDAAYTVRSLRRAPGLAITVVLTLALGLGANGAIFALADRVFLRPPPGVSRPGDVRRVYLTQHNRFMGRTRTRAWFGYPEFLDVAAAGGPGVRVAAYASTTLAVGRGDGAPRVAAVHAGPGYFALLGVRPALGRFFSPDEERIETAPPVVVVSHAFWRRQLGGDPGAVGQTLELGRERVTIVGVAPPGFAGVDLAAVDLWRPLGALSRGMRGGGRPWYEMRGMSTLRLLARPARDADIRQLAARATTAFRRPDPAAPGGGDTAAVVSTGPIIAARGPGESGDTQGIAITARLAGVALMVLLIACANVANLLLARAVERRREIAVRLALGIGAARLRAMLLTESVLLAGVGGAAALLMAAWGGAALRAWLMPDVQWGSTALDARTAVFTVAAALGTGLLAGFAPAVRASRPDLTAALKAGARDGTFQRSRLRAALVVVQAALSVLLLAGAGLFVRSLHNVQQLEIGYDADQLVFGWPIFADGGGSPERDVVRAAGLVEIAERLARAPGVERAALTSLPPMAGSFDAVPLFLAGRDSVVSGSGPAPLVTGASPDFFATVGMRIVRGRGFTAADRAAAPRVLVVNRTMARALWPGQEPLGQCVRIGARTSPCATVVGVAEEGRRAQIIEPPSLLYYAPLAQPPADGWGAAALVVRAAPGRTPAAAAAVGREVARAFPAAEPRVLAMAEILDPQLRPWRLGATLFSLLGALALAVAALGVYSTVAYTVGQRTHEFGVRIALGARTANIVGGVLAAGLRAAAVGVVLGAALALGAGRLVASLLYGVSPRDPGVLGAVAATLLAVALLASLVPAWRAARVDPAKALRTE